MVQPTILGPELPPWMEASLDPGNVNGEQQNEQATHGEPRSQICSQDPMVAETLPPQEEQSGGPEVECQILKSERDEATDGRTIQRVTSEARRDHRPGENISVGGKGYEPTLRGALVDPWILTLGELFADPFKKVKADKDRVLTWKKTHPKLKRDESVQLLRFFKEAFIKDKGTYGDWAKYASVMSHDIYNTSWNFKTIVRSMLSKMEWARAPVLNQWVDNVNQG
ncbi:hypothetical protein ON010_g2577 [Phytophthora cinnamomi]|nr:hypothetical protein ON010_g2577 [Phytophthora cinnamomi]